MHNIYHTVVIKDKFKMRILGIFDILQANDWEILLNNFQGGLLSSKYSYFQDIH